MTLATRGAALAADVGASLRDVRHAETMLARAAGDLAETLQRRYRPEEIARAHARIARAEDCAPEVVQKLQRLLRRLDAALRLDLWRFDAERAELDACHAARRRAVAAVPERSLTPDDAATFAVDVQERAPPPLWRALASPQPAHAPPHARTGVGGCVRRIEPKRS